MKARLKTVLACIFLLNGLNGCHIYGPPPGHGEKAGRFYAKAEPIIQALEQYRKKEGEYPGSLEALKSGYLPKPDWPSHGYKKKEDGYELWFYYEGPGINTCIYKPPGKWECTGLI